ncbi:serine/threonine protein kinase [bacterium]|nr:serine/threonine protein kinase [bacterium]
MKKPQHLISAVAEYKVGRKIGQGGAGFVYEVLDGEGNQLAAKLIKTKGVSTGRRRRFENELNFGLQNDHKNVITISDYGTNGSEDIFFIMPFYERSLRQALPDISPESVPQIAAQILDGLEAAHLKNVIHRDLKPENILVAGTGVVVLTDFGIARFTEDLLLTAVETSHGERLANFQYAAPEQRIRGGKITQATDLYAFGLILNELFTGELAVGQGYTKIQGVSEDHSYLDSIVERLLQNDPSNRYQTVEEIKKDLVGFRDKYVSLQRLSELKNEVVPEFSSEDELVVDPPRIIDADWDRGTLIIKFQHSLPQEWTRHFGGGNHRSFVGHGPETVGFNKDTARLPISDNNAPQALEYFKSWVAQTNDLYRQAVAESARVREAKFKKAQEARIDAEQRRLDVKSKLRF